MARLEIRSPDGRTERRPVSRRQPVTIGRSSVSDIQIDDDALAAIHCRISWNGKNYEVTAVADEGVELNGVLVRKKELTTGDVIRAGEVDLIFQRGTAKAAGAAVAAGAVGRPTTKNRDVLPPVEEPGELADEDWAALGDGEGVASAGASRPAQKLAAAEQSAATEDEPVLLDEPVKPAEETPTAPPADGAKRGWGRLRPAKRPGEQDILTSPLVLGLGGLALVLLLAAGAIWFLIGREGADRLYNAAVADREAGRYAQAIRGYEQFLLEYPTDDRVMDARFALGLTRIEQHASGASPDFERALQAFDEFVRTNRDARGFDSQREPLRNLARQIASGASAAAVRTGDRRYLAPAEEGRRLFDRYAGSDGSAEEMRKRLSDEYTTAEAAVRKREYFDAAAAKIEAAIAAQDFPSAFATRSDLITRYPDLRNDRRVQSLLARTLDAERQLIQPVASNEERELPDGAVGVPREADNIATLTFVGHTQARAGEVSDGRLVFAVARDTLMGLDAVTGRPRWRTSIGLDTPFFPVEVDASVPALLAFDATRYELLLLRRETGEPLWRTSVGQAAVGPPLVAQGQIDLATVDGQLLRYDVESGERLAGVAFPQPVIGPPVLTAQNERLVVFGDQATAYTLNYRSLAVEAVSYTGHAPGAIESPPQALGRLVVICENDRLDSAVVRAYSIDPESGRLQLAAAARVPGRVRQPAVARGNLLFVPSSPERITAFSVSDDAGQRPLTQLSGLPIPDGQEVPLFLVPGPDGMLWAAGSALRKLRLAADGLELLQGTLAPGRHTQPPQESGESLFVARSLPATPAIYVSQADRDAMTGSWRVVIGAAITAFAAEANAATIVTEAGQAAVVAASDLTEGGFADLRPLPQWDEQSPEPLRGASLSDGHAVVWRGGQASLLWTIAAGTLPGQPRSMADALECAPVALDGGLVLPLPGRLEWFPLSGGTAVESFLLPVGGEGQAAPKWRHLVRLDDERLAAADDRGVLRVIRLRGEPLPHLAEIAAVALESPLSHPPIAVDERLAVVVGSRLQLLDPAGLRPVAEAAFDVPPTAGPWSAGDKLFLDAGSGRLVALDRESLSEQWRLDLESPVAGGPVWTNEGWFVATQTGTIRVVDEGGAEQRRLALGTALVGLRSIGETVVALGLDGSLHAMTGERGEAEEGTPEPEPAGETRERDTPPEANTSPEANTPQEAAE
jgi:outer membrane protein assembly factor BamB/TolA-binding protein